MEAANLPFLWKRSEFKYLRERFNISVPAERFKYISIPAETTHFYRNAVPEQKYLRARPSHAIPHYIPGENNITFYIFI